MNTDAVGTDAVGADAVGTDAVGPPDARAPQIRPAPSRRDSQRALLYRAEDLTARLFDRSVDHPVVEIAGSRITLPVERHFADISSVQRYVNEVLALTWVRRTWGAATMPVAVRERRGPGRAHYSAGVIAVPLHGGNAGWALRELVVLHELAHHLTPIGAAPHGPEFVGRLLQLTGGLIGPEAAFVLRVAMADVGVRAG